MSFFNSEQDLRTYLGNKLAAARQALANLDADYLLSENQDVLLATLMREHIPEPVRVDWAAATRSNVTETKTQVHDQFVQSRVFEVPASRIVLTFPVLGDANLLTHPASMRSLGGLDGRVTGKSLVLEIEARDLSPDLIRTSRASLEQDYDQRAQWANADLQNFRQQAEITLRRDCENRRQRVLSDRALEDAIGIPVRSTTAAKLPVPAKRKQVTLETRRSQATYVPEPTLDDAIYHDVLDQAQGWARSLERTPGTLARLAEEELRDLLLALLNGYWKGGAGGELFNGSGKTDILIRENDRNVFVAECKIWDGPKTVTDAIDQLLSYLVWRDSKAALVFFIRTKDPTSTIAKLHAAIEAHPRYVLTKPNGDPSKQVEYVFTADEEGRRISLAVMPVVQTARA